MLAWADVRNGYQHDSISHAVATIERLGRESGAYDTFIRTDSQLITKRPITFAAGTGIASGEQFNVRNLNVLRRDFLLRRARDRSDRSQQRADLLAFVRDDGKGFVAAHSAATAFFSWPEFGEMLGGRFDEHPWGIADGTVVVDDPAFPAMRHMPRAPVFHDELYQIKDFSRDKIHVLAHLDASKLDLTRPLVHRTDGDFPAAGRRPTGRGRRVLFHPWPRCGRLGQSAAAEDVLRGDTLVPRTRGVMMKRRGTVIAAVVAAALGAVRAGSGRVASRRRDAAAARGGAGRAARAARARLVLAWADTRNGIAQHDSVSHALAVIERLGYESGLYDTYIRTDSNIIAKQPLMTDGKPASGGPSLANVDAIFFLGHREMPARRAAEGRSAVVREGRREGICGGAYGD